LDYARQRIQGKNLLQMMDKDAPAVPIIQHPDVRRMLMTMKTYISAMRSLLYYVGFCEDMKHVTDDEAVADKYQGLIEVLTPIAKGYVTDRAFEMCNLGMQVYGGYGYIREYPQEQLVRDCRITQIYEGTNGIQAMDLLGRKLGMKKGKPVMDLFGEIQATIARAKKVESLQPAAEAVEKALNKLGEIAMHMGATAMSPKVLAAFAHAYPFMDASGDVVMAWMLLWRGVVADEKIKTAKKKDQDFYEGQFKQLDFFVRSILPITIGKMKAIQNTCEAAVEISDDAFGGK
jgi:hypothetical protein